jgi:competence protein ComGF
MMTVMYILLLFMFLVLVGSLVVFITWLVSLQSRTVCTSVTSSLQQQQRVTQKEAATLKEENMNDFEQSEARSMADSFSTNQPYIHAIAAMQDSTEAQRVQIYIYDHRNLFRPLWISPERYVMLQQGENQIEFDVPEDLLQKLKGLRVYTYVEGNLVPI